jgi:hypothetical protein
MRQQTVCLRRAELPAAIAAPNLIGVAATDPEDGRAINSASN